VLSITLQIKFHLDWIKAVQRNKKKGENVSVDVKNEKSDMARPHPEYRSDASPS